MRNSIIFGFVCMSLCLSGCGRRPEVILIYVDDPQPAAVYEHYVWTNGVVYIGHSNRDRSSGTTENILRRDMERVMPSNVTQRIFFLAGKVDGDEARAAQRDAKFPTRKRVRLHFASDKPRSFRICWSTNHPNRAARNLIQCLDRNYVGDATKTNEFKHTTTKSISTGKQPNDDS